LNEREHDISEQAKYVEQQKHINLTLSTLDAGAQRKEMR
jgi:hypothetical protein